MSEAATLPLEVSLTPDQADIQAIDAALDRFDAMHMGAEQSVAVFLRDEANTLVGGAVGWIVGLQDFHLSHLWLADHLRGQGHGIRLLQRAEALASQQNCSRILTSTFNFQAPDFYPKHGYKEVGRIDDFLNGHSRIWFRKQLREVA